jgi:small-conductance mechanosensitive channel
MFGVTLSLAELLQRYIGLSQLVSETVAFVVILSLAIVIAWIGHSIFKRYLCRWAARTQTHLDDEILRNVRAPIFLLAILFGLYYGVSGFTSLQYYATELALAFTVEQSVKHERKVSNHILYILRKVLQFVIYSFALLIILGIFNVDLSGAIVGLGVGGIAIALALQSILSDALSAFSIYFERPFEIGDFIVVGDYAGTVNKIGMRSTRLQLLQGEELIISNKELTTNAVRNFKKLKKRRITFTVQVSCDTPIEKLKKIPEIIAEIIKKIKMTELGTVHFRQFGAFSFDFDVVYYVKTGDYTRYLDIQQKINFEILEEFAKEKIEMPYPTQKVFYVNERA